MLDVNKCKASARVFLEYDGFNFIIDSCLLKPKNNWMTWVDEDDNKLRITKYKNVLIYPSKKSPNTTKDIYKKSLPSHIAKHSEKVMLVFGHKKEVLLFWGKDNLLRVSLFENKIWKNNISPLLLGFKFLTKVEEIFYNKKTYIEKFKLFKMMGYSHFQKFPVDDYKVLKLLEKN